MIIRHCKVGGESTSGLAVYLTTDDGEDYWVPLSLVNRISRDSRMDFQDEIDIEDWWCRKNGLA